MNDFAKWLQLGVGVIGMIAAGAITIGVARADVDELKRSDSSKAEQLRVMDDRMRRLEATQAATVEAIQNLKESSSKMDQKLDKVLERLPR